jgi:hypothetical protein
MMMAGIFGMINGLIAIIHDEVYVVGEEQIVAFDFTQWGWIHLILGGVVFAASLVLLSGSNAFWARLVAVALALMHATAQIAWIQAYPFWSITIIGLCVIIIYALLVHPEDEVVPE